MTTHPNRGAIPRPVHILHAIGRGYPEAWSQIDDIRRGREELGGWPEWCYCPMAGAHAVVHAVHARGADPWALDARPDLMADVQAVAALSAWRVSQGIYRFDPALAAAIKPTPITTIPVEVLYRLPEWCVYIEEAHEQGCGFFAHLEYDANDGRAELRLLLDLPDNRLMGMALHLSQPTLDLAIEAFLAESRRQMIRMGNTHTAATMPTDLPGELAESIAPLLNLVLYICSANAEWPGAERPERPRPTRTKRGWKLFPPDKPRVWEMGARIGAALRAAHLARQIDAPRATTEKGRAAPVPHVRRAHWHTYRTGPGRLDSTLKWLAPIAVNLDGGDITPTIHPVRP